MIIIHDLLRCANLNRGSSKGGLQNRGSGRNDTVRLSSEKGFLVLLIFANYFEFNIIYDISKGLESDL